MKLRFSPVYVDENNVLTDEGRNLREKYLSKKDLNASLFTLAQPLLCIGFDKDKCPPPLLPLIKELKDKGIIVEVKDGSAERQKVETKKAFDEALIKAKVEQIEEELKKDHDLKSTVREEVLKGELDSALDILNLRYNKEILGALRTISSSLGARVALVMRVEGVFKAFECSVLGANTVKIRLSTLVHQAAQVYSSFSETDVCIRSDKSAKEPDVLCEAITISRSNRAKLYMLTNFKSSHEPYVLAVTTLPDAGDGLVLLEARKCIEKLDALLR